ncbi:ATP-dependent Clp protease ATP-binding subunit [bacterium]|nr:ATP-dependent Clp protease ATP-binding subunit [bacterium]
MILHVPVLVRRERSGRYVLSTLGPPARERAGMILEDVKARLAKDVRTDVGLAAKGSLWEWFARPAGRAERLDLRIELRVPGGKKTQVVGRFTAISHDAPGALEGKIVHVPRAGIFLHVPPGRETRDVVTRALERIYHEEPTELASLAVERSEWVHVLEVPLHEKALVDKQRSERDKPSLLEGATRGRRRKRHRDELEHAATLLEVGADLCALAREGLLGTAHGRDALVRDLGAAVGDDVRVKAALLVGEPGTGKTAIVHELARALETSRKLEDARGHRRAVFSIQASRLMAGMRFLGDWQDRCLALVEEAEELSCVLHFDSLPALVAAGRTQSSERTTVAQLLKPFIASGRISVIAEATPEGRRRCEEIDRSLVELFRPIRVREPSAGEALEIALRKVREIEGRRPVAFDPRAVRTSLDLLRRFVPGEAFPQKAVRFLERIAEETRERVSPARVISFFSSSFGLSPEILEDSTPIQLSRSRERLEERVRGQDEAVSALVDVIATLKAGLKDPEKPLASLLFVGPTGVGKTESAKALAELLFGSEERLLRFDMNEASDAGAAERLAGSAFSPEGELTRAIRERPFAVVLLDEVEKAHPSVLDLLLQLLGEGRLTDALGRTADARNSVFILTSNLGADRADRTLGFPAGVGGRLSPPGAFGGGAPENTGDATARYRRAVLDFFRPELVNRLDRIVAFAPLGAEALRTIAAREIEALLRREGVSRRRILIEADLELTDALVKEGVSPRYGARPLRRAIERRMAAPLAAVLAARPGAQDLLVSLRHDARGEVAIELEELVGLGPIEPFAGPGELGPAGDRSPAEQAREIAARLSRLERSRERQAITRALVDAAHSLKNAAKQGSLDESRVSRLSHIENEVFDLREAVDAVIRPLDDDGYHERDDGREHVPSASGKGRGIPRSRIVRQEIGSPRREELRALHARVERLELATASAFAPDERVALHLRGLGSLSRIWLARLAWLYERLFESQGISVSVPGVPRTETDRESPYLSRTGAVVRTRGEVSLEVSFAGARAWLAGEAGLHELVTLDAQGRPGNALPELCRVRVVSLARGEPIEAALAKPDPVRLLSVTRKYVERLRDARASLVPERIDDVRQGLTAKATERRDADALRAFLRPLEEIVVASALAARTGGAV